MRRIIGLVISGLAVSGLLTAQTLNVQVGNVTYQFPAAQTYSMPFDNGSTLTVMGKAFALSDIDNMYVDETEVTDGSVKVVYNGSSAAITVAGNVAQYLTIAQSGAHVSIAQSSDLATEITYSLSGSSSDGGFYMSGSYKATVELNGLTLTNVSATYSGAAVHVQNGKRIDVKVITGTTNTLRDASTGSQKGCLYIKGHAEFKQKGTLNMYGNLKHAIKTGEYFTIKNATINVLSAVGDGINCSQYFLMESGAINISGVGDDGIQCDIDDSTTGSTGETTDHEDEDSGNVYVNGGTINITVTATAAKGIKADGDLYVTGGTVNITTSGIGKWDTDDLETKSSACLSSDGNMSLSGGTLTLSSSGSGGKGIKSDGTFMLSDSAAVVITTTGGLFYSNGTTTNTNYTGNTDRIDNSYYSSPKGVKAKGAITIDGGKIFVTTSGRNAEGIESKSTLTINGGEIAINAYDDAINSASNMTINGGFVYARATNNDGLDANGNCYIKGGLVYAIGSSSPEVAIDANTEGGYKLYVQGGTIVAVGGLESGASISGGTCKQTSSWTANAWYALYNGSDLVFVFKTPTKTSSGGGGGPGGGGSSQKLVVYTSSTPSLKSGVTSGGTQLFDGVAYYPATATGGSSVTLSSYSSSGGGPGGW